jgi:hypothetical protein
LFAGASVSTGCARLTKTKRRKGKRKEEKGSNRLTGRYKKG